MSANGKCYLCGWRHAAKNFVKCEQVRGTDYYVIVCENCFRQPNVKDRVEQKRAEVQRDAA